MATTSPESATQRMEDRNRSVLVRFSAAPNVTTEQYDETIRRLEKSGDWLPDGLEYPRRLQVERQLPSQQDLGLAEAARRVR